MESEKKVKESILTGRKFQINPKLLHRFFEAKSEEIPEAIALIFDGKVNRKVKKVGLIFVDI